MSEDKDELIEELRKDFIECVKLNNDLNNENRELKKRIDKAIEYIKSRQNTLNEIRISRILQILEGDKE